MYSKLIPAALLGALIMGLAAQGLAAKNSGYPAFKTADGYVTSNFAGSGGSDASFWLKSEARSVRPARKPKSGQEQITRSEEQPYAPPATTERCGYYLYDSRDPKTA